MVDGSLLQQRGRSWFDSDNRSRNRRRLRCLWRLSVLEKKRHSNAPHTKKLQRRPACWKPFSFLTLIASVIAAAAYNLANDPSLFYFGHTPEALLLYVTLIPCLAIVLVVPPLLLKLRASINHQAPIQEIAKWASLTGVGYLVCGFLV